MKNLILSLIGMIFILFSSGCYKHDLPPVSVGILNQYQSFMHDSGCTNVPDGIQIDYIIYNNTPHILERCDIQFIIYYKDSTFAITEFGDAGSTGIVDHQRNNLFFNTTKEKLYVDVYSVTISGVGGCKYNIVDY